MKKDMIGPCSQQLYAQFLYRILLMKKIYNLSNINIYMQNYHIYILLKMLVIVFTRILQMYL